MVDLPASTETSPSVVSPWDEATFELLTETMDVFQVAESLKRQQDRLGGIWASEYLPGLFPDGGFLNAAAALSAYGRQYENLEEASSWEAVKETWFIGGAPEEELRPFSYALAHIPLTPEQALEAGRLIAGRRFVAGTILRRFAHNPVFKDVELYRTMADPSNEYGEAVEFSRFKLSFFASRYAHPEVVERLFPLVWDRYGKTPPEHNLTAKNPALRSLHGRLVQAASPGYMNDDDASTIVSAAMSVVGELDSELRNLASLTVNDLKENNNFARARVRTLLYVVASSTKVRSLINTADQNRLSLELGRLHLPAVMNSADWVGRNQTGHFLALPHVARYVKEELNNHGVDAGEVPLSWLLELIGEQPDQP